MEVSGRIKVIGQTQEFGSNGFRKRELVVTTAEQYPQTLLIEFTQNNTAMLDSYNMGDEVLVQINLRGREWTNPQGEVKYFVSLNGWRIEALTPQAAAGAPAGAPQAAPAPAAGDAPAASAEEDDLPF
ncbi:DUF3127 domain-containing protein [bacterium SCSIO 12741]|nr:DUF3127 domain-containing protein [bacterium SCSIO 12741]